MSNKNIPRCPDCGGDLLGNAGDWIRHCPHCDVYVRFPTAIEAAAMLYQVDDLRLSGEVDEFEEDGDVRNLRRLPAAG